MIRLPLVVGVCLLVASAGGLPAAAVGVDGAEAAGSACDPGLESGSSGERLLVVTDAETGEELLSVPVAEGTTVALNYTHSVERTPVLDAYEVNGTELEMVRMEFESFGAGLPSRADVNRTDEGRYVFDPEGSYETLTVKPGEIAGHELIVADRTCDLVALSDGRSVTIRVTNRSATTSDLPN